MRAPVDGLRVFLGLVFVGAGVYRTLRPNETADEFAALQLPLLAGQIGAAVEAAAGLLLLLQRFTRSALVVLGAILVFMVANASWVAGPAILGSLDALFVFEPNATEIFLHLIYLGAAGLLFWHEHARATRGRRSNAA